MSFRLDAKPSLPSFSMLRSGILFASVLALVASVRAASSARPIDLFASQDFTGLQYVVTPATDIKAVCTRKEGGVISVSGSPIGYLATTASYENYKLHVEWRWPADAAKNSSARAGTSRRTANTSGGTAAGG